jgi:hypothetical protein
MKKNKYKIILGLVIFGGAISYLLIPNERNSALEEMITPVEKVLKVENKQLVDTTISPKIAQTATGTKIDASKIYDKRLSRSLSQIDNPLDTFEREELMSPKFKIALVKGIVASLHPINSLKRLHTRNGLNFYESDVVPTGTLPVVYNHKTGQYGMLTGEIVINKKYKQAKKFAQDNNVKISYDNQMMQLLILSESNLELYQSYLNHESLEASAPRPDVVYNKIVPK